MNQQERLFKFFEIKSKYDLDYKNEAYIRVIYNNNSVEWLTFIGYSRIGGKTNIKKGSVDSDLALILEEEYKFKTEAEKLNLL